MGAGLVAKELVDGLDQARRGAEVAVEAIGFPGHLRVAHGLTVGVDVPAAEGVDGLLGIAHEEEDGLGVGRGVQKDAAEDVVLDGVGILKLVDQCRLELRAQGGGQGWPQSGVAKCLAYALEQIVEGLRLTRRAGGFVGLDNLGRLTQEGRSLPVFQVPIVFAREREGHLLQCV